MPTEQIETLLEKYYNGDTSPEEESQLRAFFQATRLLPDHLKVHAVQFQAYQEAQQVEVDKFLADDWLFEKIEKPLAVSAAARQAPARSQKSFFLKIAASISLLLIAFWAGNHYRQQGLSTASSPEIVALQREVREMKQVLATTSSVEGASASDRIRVVSQEFNTEAYSAAEQQEVTRLLIKTMHADENVNVRLAACEALFQFREVPEVRQAFLQGLGQEKNPLMQIALIEVVTHLKDKEAVPQLQRLVNQENLLPIVKYKAQEGLGSLI